MTVKRFSLSKEKRRLKQMKRKGRVIFLSIARSYKHCLVDDESNSMKLWIPSRSPSERMQSTSNRSITIDGGTWVLHTDRSSQIWSTSRVVNNGRFA